MVVELRDRQEDPNMVQSDMLHHIEIMGGCIYETPGSVLTTSSLVTGILPHDYNMDH